MNLKKIVISWNLLTYGIVYFFIAILLFCFWQSDLQSWDMPGHVLASDYYREYLWPWFQGWNHQSFGGYPQGYFYPSSLHWVVGGLSRVVNNTEMIFRLVISFSILILPLSLAKFLKSLGIRDESKCLIILWFLITLTLIKTPPVMGGDFFGTFAIGLVTMQLALPLFFFYLASLKEGSKSIKGILLSSILLFSLIVTHVFTSVAALLFSLVYFVLFYLKEKKWKNYAIHLVLGLLLSSFWLLPFLYFRKFTAGTGLIGNINLPLLVFSAVLAIILLLRKKNPSLKPILFSSILLFVFICFFYLFMFRYFPGFPIHLYRLLVFQYIFLGIMIAAILAHLRKYTKIIFICSAILLFLSLLQLQEKTFPFWKREVIMPPETYFTDGLGLITTETPKMFVDSNAPHLLPHYFLQKEHKLLNGLFIESSGLTPAIQSLLQEGFTLPFGLEAASYPTNRVLLKEHLRYLGVCWVLSLDENLSESLEIKPELVSATFLFDNTPFSSNLFLYHIPCVQSEIIAPPKKILSSNWDTTVREWWVEPGSTESILVESENIIPYEGTKISKNASVNMVEFNPPAHYKFFINSETEQFVYLKIPYFPNWKAYKNGEEIQIWRASPSMMVIKASGEVELIFTRHAIEYFSYIISISTFFLWTALYFAIMKRSKTST